MTRSPAHESADDPVLAVVDRTFLVAIPILVISIAVGLPSVARVWTLLGGVALALTIGLALRGRAGGARWRGAGYTAVTLVSGIIGMWTLGPLTAVGVAFGIAVLFAGTFLARRWLVIVILIAGTAIVSRAIVGGSFGLSFATAGRLEVTLALWLGTALASGSLLWIATRVFDALVASLAQAALQAADASRLETEARAHLESSRHELEELAQVEMVGRLAAGVAHDVNNALTAILAASDVLTTEVTTPAQRRHLAELEAASCHASDLVRDLLWIGRKFPVSTTAAAELGSTLRACLERLARVARKLAIDVDVDDALRVAVSPEHLEQILVGLAVGAHRSGVTRLAVTTELEGDTVEIGLCGSRGGEPPRGPDRTMQVQLGVSAARELVALSHGTLVTTEQAGSLLVRIRLPVAAGRRRLASEPRPPMWTALVVEDEPMVLRRLCQLVTRRGYEVSAASSVAEGLALLDAGPDLLVTDLQLPDGSGEVIALASFERDPARPIVVCSGFGADDALRERLRSARLQFLSKPFTIEELEAAIPDARRTGA